VKKDAGAQRLLYERYAPQMMTVCRRYCPSPQSAEDLLQEAFVKVFTSLHQFRSQGSLEGWIKKIFVNCALRKLERKVLAFTVLSHEQEEQFYADPEILHQLNEEELLILIRELPEGYRTVFNLHVIDGYTHDEISVMLGIATVTSRSQLAKARKQLQQKIQSIVNQ
jgi:RNA polymerase sigma-70 factor (ECF subfamily)